MKKIFTLAAAVLASFSLWAETVTFTAAEIKAGTAKSGITPYFDANPANKNLCKDGETQNKADVCEVKNSSDTILVSSLKEQAQVLFTANDKYITKIVVNGATNSTGSGAVKNIPALYWKGNAITESFDGAELVSFSGYDVACENAYYTFQNMPEKTQIAGIFRRVKVDNATNPTKKVNKSGVNFGDGQTFYVASVEITYENACTDPEAHLAFTKSTAYVGEQFSYNYGSLNGGALNTSYTLDGVPAVENTDYTFTSGNITVLKAGQFVMHRTVDAENGYCAVDVSDTILINEATPVASVTVDGPTAAYVGEAVTFTATAANASDYAWTVNGVDANTNAAEFTFTPAAAGEYSIVCSARNKFNATEEWIASDAKVLTVTSLYGQLIAADAETGSGNIDKNITATGIVGGTVHQKTQKNAKLGGEGMYFSLTLAAGSFAAGDTVKVVVTPEYNSSKDAYSAPTQLKISTALDNSNLIGESDTKVIDPASSDDLYFDIVLTEGASTIYLARDGSICKQNPIVKSISVVRPAPVDHVNVALVGVAIDGEALPNDFVSHLINQGSFTIQTSYVNAPVVAFVKHTDTYYEGETEPVSTNDSIKVTATEVEGEWQAQATIGENTYTINAAKAASVVVTYMDGETVLGTENVAINDNPAEYAQYQSKDQATFVGWYSNADLADEHAVADMSAEVITAATTYYAKFVKTYISANVNIEQLVLDYGTGYDIQSALTAAGWDYANLNSLDTLNDLENKTNRNYDFLGLKMKTAGAYIQGWCPANEGFIIKFGNLGSDIKVTITGATTNEEYTFAKADLWSEDDQAYVFVNMGFSEEVLVKISTVSNGTVVLKQLMLLNEGIQAVALPAPSAYLITIAESENGTVTASWDNKKYRTPVGATVTLTFTPAAGYIVMSCTVNGNEIQQSAPGAAITFEMPAEDVTIQTTFSAPTAIDNAEAAVKAEKVIRDGQVLILRDGKIFNALGAEVK